MKNFLLSAVFISLLGLPALAQDTRTHDHDHDHGHNHEAIDFGSMEEGWVALEDVSAEIRAAVAANNMAALHGLADTLHAVADGLGSYADVVPEANQLRYTSSLNQIRALSDRLIGVHESRDLAGAQRLVPQLNGMVQLLMVSAEDR